MNHYLKNIRDVRNLISDAYKILFSDSVYGSLKVARLLLALEDVGL